jgi:hypothetical protein
LIEINRLRTEVIMVGLKRQQKEQHQNKNKKNDQDGGPM